MTAPDTLELTPQPQALATALAWLESIAEREGWPPRLAMAITLSTDEALTNVLLYAFAEAGPAAPRVRLECQHLPRAVRVTLIDNGVAFDPTTIAEPQAADSVEEARIGGHGVQLMRHYLSTLRYARQGDENRLIMEVDWPAGSTAPGAAPA